MMLYAQLYYSMTVGRICYADADAGVLCFALLSLSLFYSTTEGIR